MLEKGRNTLGSATLIEHNWGQAATLQEFKRARTAVGLEVSRLRGTAGIDGFVCEVSHSVSSDL
jgi:hypothetical protein